MLTSQARGCSKTQAEWEVREQVAQVIADLGDLAGEELPGGKAERAAQACERLAEDLAEAAVMIRALPGTPAAAPGHTFAAVAAVATAARGEQDLPAWLMAVLCEAAVRLGCTRAPDAGRACWEAACALASATPAGAGGAQPREAGAG